MYAALQNKDKKLRCKQMKRYLDLEREKNKETIGETNGTYIYRFFFKFILSKSKQSSQTLHVLSILWTLKISPTKAEME